MRSAVSSRSTARWLVRTSSRTSISTGCTAQPFSISVDGKRRRLVMADLLPGVERDSMMYRELKEFLKGRADADVPEHRRVDLQLAPVAARLRHGVGSLELTLVEGDYEYGARKLVNLAHETFLFLSEYWADYMWENFELNME
jgi:hypothetical protein